MAKWVPFRQKYTGVPQPVWKHYHANLTASGERFPSSQTRGKAFKKAWSDAWARREIT